MHADPRPLRTPPGARLSVLSLVLAVLATLSLAMVSAPAPARGPEIAIPRAGLPTPMMPFSIGDTVVIYGPHQFLKTNGSAQEFVETFSYTPQPGQRYLLQWVNGNGSSNRVTGDYVKLNGKALGTLTSSSGSFSVEALPWASDTLSLRLLGSSGSYVTVSVLAVADPTFAIFGPDSFPYQSGSTVTHTFTLPSNGTSPFLVYFQNGNPDGSHRSGSGFVTINGTTIVTDLFGATVAGGVKTTSLHGGTDPDTIQVQVGTPSGSFVKVSVRAVDTSKPVLTISSPTPNQYSNDTVITATGTVTDETLVQVTAGGVAATLGSGNSYSAVVPLTTEGNNTFHIIAKNGAGLSVDSTRTVIRDRVAPTLSVSAPANNLITKNDSVDVTGTASDANPFTVNVNGNAVTVVSGAFTKRIALATGSNVITTTATDVAGNATTVVRTVVQDQDAPILSVSAPSNGSSTSADTVVVVGQVADATATTVTVNGASVTPDGSGNFSKTVSLALGLDTITVVATDAATNSTTVKRTITRTAGTGFTETLTYDASLSAPALSKTEAQPTSMSTSFLYTGGSPIQVGVTTGAIDTVRGAVVRGRVTDVAGAAISGVRVTVVGHPELGYTDTRSNGYYDMAVNGGGNVRLHFAKTGYLPVEREPRVGWQAIRALDDVVLTQRSSQVTAVDFSQAIEVARGPTQTDGSGSRQATVLFKQGTTASLVMPNGGTSNIGTLHVRATEFTVGNSGPHAMPAELPSGSAYTYAVDVSADEVDSAGATGVSFSQPAALYLENFLGFKVGTVVPVGSYDPARGAWVAEPNGRVIRIMSTSGGVASLDVTGDSVADTGSVLTSMGIASAEQTELAQLYSAGQTLWRSQLAHLSTFDHNWGPAGPPIDAINPPNPGAKQDDHPVANAHRECGSIIRCEDRVLGERLPIQGTPFTLAYSSDRTSGSGSRNRTIDILITEDSLPSSLAGIDVTLEVAGRKFTQQIPVLPQQHATFTWDGLDAYGRPVLFDAEATVTTTYRYPRFYAPPGDSTEAFGANCTTPPGSLGCDNTGVPLRYDQAFSAGSISTLRLGGYQDGAQGLGDWTIDAHHVFDPTSRTLYMGDGTTLRADHVMTLGGKRFAGNGAVGTSGDSGLAVQAEFQGIAAIAAGPDGSIYIADSTNNVVRRVDSTGVISRFAGTGSLGTGAPGARAAQTALSAPTGLAVGPTGIVYIADAGNNRVLAVGLNDTVSLLAGRGASGFDGDGARADSAALSNPTGLAVGTNGSVYIVDQGNSRIREVSGDGLIHTFAGGGGGAAGCAGQNQAATQACLSPVDVAMAADGSVLVAQPSSILRIRAGGTIDSIAGASGVSCSSHAQQVGLPALQVGFCPIRILGGPDGSIFVSELNGSLLRHITVSGFVEEAAVCDAIVQSTMLQVQRPGLARETLGKLHKKLPAGDCSRQLAGAPDGSLIVAGDTTVYRFDGALPTFQLGLRRIASTDGSEVYEFNITGRHLRTIDALTRVTLLSFGYNASGLLTSITDADSNTTTITRNSTTGVATAIVSPYGESTALALDTLGHLHSVTDPAGQVTSMTYDSTGMLASFRDPRGNASTFTYDSQGRLVRDRNAAGGFTQVAGVFITAPSPQGFGRQLQLRVTTVADSLGRTKSLARSTGNGPEVRKSINPAGLLEVDTIPMDGRDITVLPDSTLIVQYGNSDPRFGGQSPGADSVRSTLPSGIHATLVSGRSVVLSSPTDPMSLVAQVDSLGVDQGVFKRTYVDSTRTVTTGSSAGRTSSVVLDTKGRISQAQTPGLAAIHYTYDARGRLASIAQGDRTATYKYNAQGRLDSIVDPAGRVTRYSYDGAGRIVAESLPGGRTVTYGYDSSANLTSLRPAGDSVHTFSYGVTGLATASHAPAVAGSTGITTFAYSVQNELLSMTRPDSQQISLRYDSAGRIDSVITPEGGSGIGYDPTTGRATSLSAPGSVAESLSYDGALPTGIHWSGPVSGSVNFTYGPAFRPSNILVNGQLLNSFRFFDYDADGMPTQVGDLFLGYQSGNGLLSVLNGAGQTAFWSYDSLGQVNNYSVLNQLLTDTTFRAVYTYDKLGRITQLAERVVSDTATYAFSYDSAGRLAQFQKGGVTTAAYEYDLNGNRTRVTTQTGVVDATYDAQDRLLTNGTVTYAYTGNGELRRKIAGSDTTTYRYDALGNLREVWLQGGTHIEYVIDAQQRRIGRRVNGILLQRWLYQSQLAIVAELDSLGNALKTFEYGTRPNVPDAMTMNDTLYRIITDHLGSVRLVVNASTGAVAQQIDYDPYGVVIQNTNPGFQPFGYAGGLFDDATQLVRFGARDYDPEVGRWTSPDLEGFGADGENVFEYAQSNPINLSDPTGFDAFDDFLNSIGQGLVGLGDGATFGLTRRLRATALYGGDTVTDECLASYKLGEFLGGWASSELIGAAALRALRYLKGATGGLEQWLRLGKTYSREGGFPTFALRWGASPKYAAEIGSETLRDLNQWIRSLRVPIDNWRFADAGHFHFYRI